jgi:hypothetical protein
MAQEPTNLHRAFRALAQAGRVLTGRQIAGRGATVFPDDIFLVSYPRSGNTWTRFLLSNLIYPDEPTTFLNIESRIPEIYFNFDRAMRRLPRPRILKSHECFQPHYPRVIYVVRDPRDVAVSYYHHNVKARNIPEDYPMESFVPRFMASEFDRLFGSWHDNVLSWISLRGDDPHFLMLRYEDMKEDPARELSRMIAFLEYCSFRKIVFSREAIEKAIELSSPERMRALEKQEAQHWVLTKQTRSDKPFVRSARSGGWKSVLAPELVAALELTWGDLMQKLGYQLVSTPRTAPLENSPAPSRSRF